MDDFNCLLNNLCLTPYHHSAFSTQQPEPFKTYLRSPLYLAQNLPVASYPFQTRASVLAVTAASGSHPSLLNACSSPSWSGLSVLANLVPMLPCHIWPFALIILFSGKCSSNSFHFFQILGGKLSLDTYLKFPLAQQSTFPHTTWPPHPKFPTCVSFQLPHLIYPSYSIICCLSPT